MGSQFPSDSLQLQVVERHHFEAITEVGDDQMTQMTRWSDGVVKFVSTGLKDDTGRKRCQQQIWQTSFCADGWWTKKHHLKVPRFVQLKWFSLVLWVGLDSTERWSPRPPSCRSRTVTRQAGKQLWSWEVASLKTNSSLPLESILGRSDSLPFGQSLPILLMAFCC